MIRHVPRASLAEPPTPLELAPAAAEPVGAADEPPVRAAGGAHVAAALVALLSEELRLRPEHIVSVVERELARLRRAHYVELRVHPADLALLPSVSELATRLELRGALTAVSDPALEPGGCLLLSNLGEVDARLETRLSLALALLRSGWPT
ncbi:MAG TPA: FliH/SctL family protein [Polyangiales bacterium]